MKQCPCLFVLAVATLLGQPLSAEEAGFKTIFDGKTLDGWDGNPKWWSVQDGAITGKTTADDPLPGNTFIIWRNGETSDFELKLEYKIVGGNSGIQYRSFEVEDQKWVIGGYQGDFEAGDKYSGILYGERYTGSNGKGRGILALRGEKVLLKDGGKEVVGTVGDSDAIQAKIKKEDWNEYHIIARGNHLVHKINGMVTCDVTDKDSAARSNGVLALQVHRGPPMTVQFRNIRLKQLSPDKGQGARSGQTKKIVFVAGPKSHGYGGHEHFAGCKLLARLIEEAMPGYETVVHRDGWPSDPSAFDGADAIIIFCDGGGRHVVAGHLEQIDQLAKQGMGIACLHYGVEVPKGEMGDRLIDWIGGYFEPHWSVNPHWVAKFDQFPVHPITRGVQPFEADDEWYYHMRFRDNMEGVTPILSDLPPEDTLKRKDGAHSNNPHVRAAVLERREPQHLVWATERKDGGRGLGFTGGHWHWNWGKPNYLRVALNSVVWVAGGEIPEGGVAVRPVTMKELEQDQDYEPTKKFNRAETKAEFNLIGD